MGPERWACPSAGPTSTPTRCRDSGSTSPGVDAGTYCLASVANPPGGASQISETSVSNNERRREIEIDPDRHTAKFTGNACPAP